MTRYTIIICVFSAVALLTASHETAANDGNLEAIKNNFKERYADVLQLKKSGKIGETRQGLLEPLNADHRRDAEVKRVVEDENKDRRLLYKLAAEKNKTTPQTVAERYYFRRLRKAEPTEYFKIRSGEWQQKREIVGAVK